MLTNSPMKLALYIITKKNSLSPRYCEISLIGCTYLPLVLSDNHAFLIYIHVMPYLLLNLVCKLILDYFSTEFIHLLASEASEISEKQQKKVISPEHVVDALQTLGFHEYIDEVKQVYKEYKEQAIVSSGKVDSIVLHLSIISIFCEEFSLFYCIPLYAWHCTPNLMILILV